jgi:hypothetical protein
MTTRVVCYSLNHHTATVGDIIADRLGATTSGIEVPRAHRRARAGSRGGGADRAGGAAPAPGALTGADPQPAGLIGINVMWPEFGIVRTDTH